LAVHLVRGWLFILRATLRSGWCGWSRWSHQYDQGTRQLVSDEEQFMFEKQKAAQWVARKWTVDMEED
jgi:hypothetical protein